MKRLLGSYSVLAILFVSLFLCSFVLVCVASHSFGYYASRFTGYYFYRNWYIPALLGGFVLFVLLNYSIWCLLEKRQFQLWDKIKINTFPLTVITSALLMASVYLANLDISPLTSLILLPLFAYTVFILWISNLLYFLFQNEKYKSLSWWKFYRQFPIEQPISKVVTVMAFTLILFMMFETFIVNASSVLHIFVTVILLVILTILVRYLSSLSEKNAIEHQQAIAEKMKAERLKTELITNVSHDIKTPLTSIINYTDLLNKKGITEVEVKEYTSVLYKKSIRLKALIEDLIEASKAGTGNIKITLETINLCELMGQILGEYDEQLENSNLQLISKIPEDGIHIEADGRHIWRVMENIFSNAVKYALPKTRIYADLGVINDSCIFTLKNISKDPLNISADELTEQFVRGDRARFTEGSGLGLYIAKSLTEAMGGELTIDILGDLFQVKLRFYLAKEKINIEYL